MCYSVGSEYSCRPYRCLLSELKLCIIYANRQVQHSPVEKILNDSGVSSKYSIIYDKLSVKYKEINDG